MFSFFVFILDRTCLQLTDPHSHQTAVLTARVQLRHGHSHLLGVDADEDLDDPFVPHLAVVSLAPHADFDLGVVGHVDGSLLSS